MKRLLPITLVLVISLAFIAASAPAQAQSGNTWGVDFYPNTNWAGPSVSTQFVNLVSFDWGFGAPAPNMPVDNWTARLNTDAFFFNGFYTFTVVADDEVWVLINGGTFVDTRGQGRSGKQITFTVPMTQGQHRIELFFREYTETAYLFFNWALGATPPLPPPGPQSPPLPANQQTVGTQFGDYTPCMQQNIHQSNCFVSDGQWDSPNLGSIQMEPQIQSWVNCTPADQVRTFFVNPQIGARNFVCSRTLAGWFPQ